MKARKAFTAEELLALRRVGDIVCLHSLRALGGRSECEHCNFRMTSDTEARGKREEAKNNLYPSVLSLSEL